MPAITINAEEFKYPNRAELKAVGLETPRLKTFDFPYVNEIIELFNRIGDMEDIVRRSQLHWWDHCLKNRLGSLAHAYTTTLVHYNRGLPDDVKSYEHCHFVNRTQFGYYGETYFYFFISVRDTIAQLINIYFSMGIPENKLSINDFYKKIPDEGVKGLFVQFMADTKLTSEYRNGLTHRFLITHPDHRPSISYNNGMTFSAGAGAEITSSELRAEIKRSLLCMARFLDDLNTTLNQTA